MSNNQTIKLKMNNVASISEGEIEVKKETLNVKYGMNGIGKSTMANAIRHHCGETVLDVLQTYGSTDLPEVKFCNTISNVKLFNQDYVDTYLYNEDVANNSFELIVNTEKYQELNYAIDEEIKNLQIVIASQELKDLLNDIKNFTKSFSFKDNNEINGTSSFAKSRKLGNIIEKIEENEEINDYSNFLLSPLNHSWHKWFNEGKTYITKENKCPYCTKVLDEDFDAKVASITAEFKTTELKQNTEMKSKLDKIEQILGEDKFTFVLSKLSDSRDLNEQENKEFKDLYDLLEVEITKLESLLNLTSSKIVELNDVGKLSSFLSNHKLNLSTYNGLDEDLKNQIAQINLTIDTILEDLNKIKELSKELNGHIGKLIQEKQEFVNEFLKISGIPYSFEVICRGDKDYLSRLKPNNVDLQIKYSQLSYGEKNAISLILFTLEILDRNPDLVILDDPVSSFDNNKKYAILYYLFIKDNAVLKNITTILFTHDQEVLIDIIYKNDFKSVRKNCFVVYKEGSKLRERKVKKDNLLSSIKQWRNKSKNEELSNIVRVVNLRKYFEFVDSSSCMEYHLLSNLEHLREIPMKIGHIEGRNETIEMETVDIYEATESIRNFISDFDYEKLLTEFKSDEILKQNYTSSTSRTDKLQILKTFVELREIKAGEVLWDFLRQSYHVENNLLYSVKDGEFDMIPDYIIDACDELMEKY